MTWKFIPLYIVTWKFVSLYLITFCLMLWHKETGGWSQPTPKLGVNNILARSHVSINNLQSTIWLYFIYSDLKNGLCSWLCGHKNTSTWTYAPHYVVRPYERVYVLSFNWIYAFTLSFQSPKSILFNSNPSYMYG